MGGRGIWGGMLWWCWFEEWGVEITTRPKSVIINQLHQPILMQSGREMSRVFIPLLRTVPLSITMFFPVILALRHSTPSVFSSVAFVLKSLCPSLWLGLSLGLFLCICICVYVYMYMYKKTDRQTDRQIDLYILSPSLLSALWRGSRVSAVTALVQGLMVCNTLQAPLWQSEVPFMYKQREVILVCVCVCIRRYCRFCSFKACILLLSFPDLLLYHMCFTFFWCTSNMH